jgi:hypothetical protein
MAGAMNAWNTNSIGCKEKGIQFKEQKINDGKV